MSKAKSSKIQKIINEIEAKGLNYAAGAREFGINVQSLYNYRSRQKKKSAEQINQDPESQTGIGDDQMESRTASDADTSQPDHSDQLKSLEKPGVPSSVETIIIDYRKAHPDHGFKRIEEHLKKKYFIVISRKEIRKVLKSVGLHQTLDSSFDKSDQNRMKGTRRFEAAYPRDLYQMDVTYVYISKIPVLYLVDIVDDYSRFCVGAELKPDQQGTTMMEVLHRAVERYGKPRRLLTDQGSSFYSWSHEKTLFQNYLDDMHIEHIVSDPHSPQTLGKVERFHQTVQKELLKKRRFANFEEARRGIEDYVRQYNYNREHQGIKGTMPADRFFGIAGETDRIEASLSSKEIDFSKGYLLFKNQEHTVSVVCSAKGLEVLIDGNLLEGGRR